MPVGALTIFSDKPIADNFETKALPRPYIVEAISPEGNIAEFKGLSLSGAPFEIAGDLGALPNKADKFTAFPEIKMGIGSKITLYRAPHSIVVDGKKATTYYSWANTVGELFSQNMIELGKDDKINFSLDTALENNMEIKIVRVAKTTVVETENIDFKTVKRSNSNIEKGNKKTLQAGQKGKRAKTYAVTREDGVQISKVLIKSEIAEAPIEEIIEVGTKVAVYGSGKATWYGWPKMEKKNAYYAAHKNLPKGTEVWVVNTANGKGVKVTILDRVSANVEIDLSTVAFKEIGSLGSGVINVRVEKYYPE